MTEQIFAAAGVEDRILMAARQMSIVSRRERIRLRDQCTPAFAKLRRLAREHFPNHPAIPPAIDELERSLGELALLPGVPDDGLPADRICPACGSVLVLLGKNGISTVENQVDSYCSPCLDIIRPPLLVLSSWDDGFATDAI